MGFTCMPSDCTAELLAIEERTSTKTRTGATPFKALTKIVPRIPTEEAAEGQAYAKAMPRMRPTRICFTSEP